MFKENGKLMRSFFVIASVSALFVLPIACGGGGGGGGNGGPPPVTVPSVLSTTPDDGAVEVPEDTEVIINFSEAMNPTSVVTGLDVPAHSGTTIALWQVGNTRVDLTFVPSLLQNTHYVVTLDAGILDAEGTSMGAAYSFSFNTGSVPTAWINYPAPFETNVSRSPIISISFSEQMDTDSVQESFNVTSYTGSLNYFWSGSGLASTLDVSFASSLDPNTTYTAALLPFAEDDDGTPLGVQSTVTFSTGTTFASGAISGVIDDDPDSNYDNNLEDTIMALWDHDFTNTEGPPPVLGTADASGAYHFSFLEDGNYWILAVQDTNGDGEIGGEKFAEPGDSLGVWPEVRTMTISPVTVNLGSHESGISFDLFDTEGISGEVTYAGSDTAAAYAQSTTVFVGAFTSSDLDSGPPLYGAASETSSSGDFDDNTNIWNYAINAFFETGARMMTGNYYIAGYIDLDNNSAFDPDRNGDDVYDDGEPAGIFHSTVPILAMGQDAVGVDITAYDTITIFGAIDSISYNATLDTFVELPVSGGTITLLDYPLTSASDGTGDWFMSFVPSGTSAPALAVHAEKSGSGFMPMNTKYKVPDSGDAFDMSDPFADGFRMNLINPNVFAVFNTACNVTVNASLAQIGGIVKDSGPGDPPLVGADVIFSAANTVYYLDSQFNCTTTSTGDGEPNFFIFNADESLFADSKGTIAASDTGSIFDSAVIPVRNGEFTWVELEK